MAAKKRILIVSHFMMIGGAERALLGLLEAMDLKQYEVDLFLFRHEGELLPYIPSGINLLPEQTAYTMLARPLKEVVQQGYIKIATARLVGKIAAGLYNRTHRFYENSQVDIEYSHKFTRYFMPPISPKKEYDLAISFLTPHYFVAEKVDAKKKIAWIHTDYSSIKIDIASELAMWSKYQKIIAISQLCSQSFLEIFPTLKEKVLTIENPLPAQLIKHQAKETVTDLLSKKQDETILLSIGRFCEAKNFDNIPQICRKIREMGCNVKWYLIGFGAMQKTIEQRIEQEGMKDYVILLGKKENPYPYINQCDWYVQPSRYEGKAVTVCEAQLLNKPVIITAYKTAASQLKNGIDGIIVPLDTDACAQQMEKTICDHYLRATLIENTKKMDYSQKSELDKLYALMED